MQRLKGDVSWQVNKDLGFLNALNHFHLELMRRCLHVEFPQEISPIYDEVNYDLCRLRGQALWTRRLFFFMEMSSTARPGLTDKLDEGKRSDLICCASVVLLLFLSHSQPFRPAVIEKCSKVHLQRIRGAPRSAESSFYLSFHTFM